MTILTQQNCHFPETVPGLPPNYNFEIPKTLRTIAKLDCKRIALQFPDGLLCYAPILIDTIQEYFPHVDCTILDDVVYGACCVDDRSLEMDLLIHYGHSCLIPVSEMETRVLYVFVDIKIDVDHLCEIIEERFKGRRVGLIGTIQFNSSVHKVARKVNGGVSAECVNTSTECVNTSTECVNTSTECVTGCACNKNNPHITITIPQVKPLSPGEVLGCTAPHISSVDDVIYIGDGRFHLESAMIKNPRLNFFKYCPFTRKMTREFYDFDKMKENRENEIRRAFHNKNGCFDRKSDGECDGECDGRGARHSNNNNNSNNSNNSNNIGVILGTLGRQGNVNVFERVIAKLETTPFKIYRIVMNEINERELDKLEFIDAFVQVSCPRLSIDWGMNYRRPLLTPFEVFYSEEKEGGYEMDYYSREGFKPWRNDY